MNFARLLQKLFRGEEQLELEDWILITTVGTSLFLWIYENSQVEVTTTPKKVTLQSRKMKKKDGKYRND
jgi:hypothetical protein